MLYSIGHYAFLMAFKSSEPITITVGSEVIVMGTQAFGNSNDTGPNNTLIIGSSDNKSKLDLSKIYFAGDDNRRVRIYTSDFNSIIFYSLNYKSPLDMV
jgi:hypothetical protein